MATCVVRFGDRTSYYIIQNSPLLGKAEQGGRQTKGKLKGIYLIIK